VDPLSRGMSTSVTTAEILFGMSVKQGNRSSAIGAGQDAITMLHEDVATLSGRGYRRPLQYDFAFALGRSMMLNCWFRLPTFLRPEATAESGANSESANLR